MWDVPRWTEYHEYEMIIVENVPDVRKWRLFEPWLQAMNKLGYDHEEVYLNSMFAYPTPQSRNRLYVVFWKEGNEAPDLDIRPPAYCRTCDERVQAVQSWRDTNLGQRRIGLRYGQQYNYRCPQCTEVVEPYRYAAFNVIDWSVDAPRIADRDRPLADNTIERIEEGLDEYGGDPLVITDRPPEACGAETVGLVDPGFLQKQNSGPQRPRGFGEPIGTQTTSLSDAIVGVPPQITSVNYFDGRVIDSTTEAYPTQTTQTKWAVLEPPVFLAKLHGTSGAEPITDALGCVMAGGNHHALIQKSAFLSYYYSASNQATGIGEPTGTMTTKDRAGLVENVSGAAESTDVGDCRFRMLTPDEVQRAMGFPDDYTVTGTQKSRVKQLGNAVTPPAARLLVERCKEALDR
jgi:DNA (cytosine-5)-methyltransferase 1